MHIICFGVYLGQCWCFIYNYEAFCNIDPGLSRLDEIGYNLGNKLQISHIAEDFLLDWLQHRILPTEIKIRDA